MSLCHNPPSTAVAGTQISFLASTYSSEFYTLQFAFNNGVDQPAVVDGETVENADWFQVTTTAPTKPGVYSWGEVFTKIADGTAYVGRQGTITIQANPLLPATPSTAATILAKLQTAYTSRADNSRGSVSFNGQSVTWNSPAELRGEITFWEARVIQEQRDAACLRGDPDPRLIRPNFLPPTSVFR